MLAVIIFILIDKKIKYMLSKIQKFKPKDENNVA